MLLPSGRAVPVNVRRHARSRRFVLRVSGGVIQLTIPTRARLRDADAWLRTQADFIARQLAAEGDPVPFVMGARLPVLGETVSLVPGLTRHGLVDAGTLAITPAAPDVLAGRVEACLRRTVREAATSDLRSAWDALAVPPAEVTVRAYRRRWGACARDGRTAINWRLVFAPRDVLRYVCVHEAAHRVEMNHGPRFWQLVEALMPGFRAEERWLRENGARLAVFGQAPG